MIIDNEKTVEFLLKCAQHLYVNTHGTHIPTYLKTIGCTDLECDLFSTLLSPEVAMVTIRACRKFKDPESYNIFLVKESQYAKKLDDVSMDMMSSFLSGNGQKIKEKIDVNKMNSLAKEITKLKMVYFATGSVESRTELFTAMGMMIKETVMSKDEGRLLN